MRCLAMSDRFQNTKNSYSLLSFNLKRNNFQSLGKKYVSAHPDNSNIWSRKSPASITRAPGMCLFNRYIIETKALYPLGFNPCLNWLVKRSFGLSIFDNLSVTAISRIWFMFRRCQPN